MELSDILTFLTSNWQFFAASVILAIATEALKKLLLKGKGRVQNTIKALLPLFPVLIGGIAGILLPESIDKGTAASVLYFAFAGALSSWVYEAFRRLALPGIDFLRRKLSGSETQSK